MAPVEREEIAVLQVRPLRHGEQLPGQGDVLRPLLSGKRLHVAGEHAMRHFFAGAGGDAQESEGCKENSFQHALQRRTSSKLEVKGQMMEMSIGDLSQRSGVPASTIRYYEELRLLPRPERTSGRRVFDEE